MFWYNELIHYSFLLICHSAPVMLQAIQTPNSCQNEKELAIMEQSVLENVRPILIALTKRTMAEFVSSTNLQLQRAESKISESNRRIEEIKKTVTRRHKEYACSSNGRGFMNDKFCFVFSSDKLTWEQARDKCKTMNGYLAVINSSSITEFLRSTGIKGYYYGGGHDRTAEGSWIWDETNQVFSYTNWNRGEPNNSGRRGEDCLGIIMGRQAIWNDSFCSERQMYICQIPLE